MVPSRKNLTPLTPDQTSVFCYQLSLMQKAGISSEESVSILLGDAGTDWEKDLYGCISKHLVAGERLHAALAQTGVFPDYLLRMVEIGEASGRLEQVLIALSEYYRREAVIKSAIRRAVTYPAVMAVLIALIFLVLIARVLPVFRQVFDQLGMSLSPVTAALLRLGSVSQSVAAVLAAILIAGAVFLFFLFHTAKGGEISGKLGRTLFKNSAAARLVNRSRFAGAMDLMLSSGLPLDEAMDRTARLLQGTALEPRIKDCKEKIYQGQSFPQAVEQSGILDGLQSGLLAAGFRTGVSEQAMAELARRLQEEADAGLDRLLGRFEYALVLILCISVGLVLLSVMLPLLGVMSAIGT